MTGAGTVVVAWAPSAEGEAAVAAAADLAAEGSDDTFVLVPATRDGHAPAVAELEERWPALASRLAVEHGDLSDPSDAVVQVAQRHDARLVVLGLHRRSPVGKMIFGSTAQRIILDATCPVLAVKPPAHQR